MVTLQGAPWGLNHDCVDFQHIQNFHSHNLLQMGKLRLCYLKPFVPCVIARERRDWNVDSGWLL